MSRPRRSIRRKLLWLLLAIGLGPLSVIGWLDFHAFNGLGVALAGQLAQALSEQARSGLAQQADEFAHILQREREQLALILRLQSREVERALASAAPANQSLLWAQTFNAATALAAPPLASPYYRQTNTGERLPLAHTQNAMGMHHAAAVAPATVIESARRLTNLTAFFQTTRDTEGALIFWQFVALKNGLFAVFPGHGGFSATFDARQMAAESQLPAPGTVQWSASHADFASGQSVISATMAVRDGQGRVAGVTGLDVRVTQLLARLVLPSYLNAPGRVLVLRTLDDRMEVVVKKGRADLEAEWLDPPQASTLTLDRPDQQTALLSDLQQSRDGLRTVRYQGGDSFCVYRRLDANGLYLVLLVPVEATIRPAQDAGEYALASTRRQVDAVLPLVLGVAGLIVLLAILAARSITVPISRLERAVHALANGDFTARVNLTTGDELAALAASFNQMIPRLAEQTRTHESLALAREVQQRMLPSAAPQFPGTDIAGMTIYCDETGGDYFDYLDGRLYGRNTLGVVVGDVAGHGIAAALLMTSARALLHGMAASQPAPAQILQQLNLQLAADVRPGHFMTLFSLSLDFDQGQLSWASAGHDPALWWHADTGTLSELTGVDIPLGIDPNWRYTPAVWATIGAGDVLLVATDGVWDTRALSGERFGKARLQALLAQHHAAPAVDICTELLSQLRAFRGAAEERDDVTVVVVKIAAALANDELAPAI